MNRRTTAIAFGWTAFFSVINRLLLPLTSIYFSRVLGPAPMGVFFLAFNVLTVLEVLRDGGLGQTFIADRQVDEQGTKVYNALGILSGAVPGVLVWVFSEPIGRALNLKPSEIPALWVVGFVLVMNGFLTILEATLQKEGRFKDLGFCEARGAMVGYTVAVVGVASGFGLWALLAMMVVKAAVHLALVFRCVKPLGVQMDGAQAKKIIRSSSPVLSSMLMGIPFGLVDNLIVANRLGTVQSGFYGNARTLAVKPAEVLAFPLGRTLYSAYSARKDDPGIFANAFARSLTAAVLFVAPIYVFLAAFCSEIVFALFGQKWMPSAPLLLILCVYYGIRSVGTLGGSALTASGRASLTLYCWLLAYLTTIPMLASRWGSLTTEWVAISFCAGAGMVYLSQTGVALRLFRADRAKLALLGQMLGLLLVHAGYLALVRMLPGHPVAHLIGAMLTMPVLHLALVGIILERRPQVFLSASGIKRLYRAL